jgi:pseudaminic acid biosynthesis-associated methylase
MTAQVEQWIGDFGRQYTERNMMTPKDLDSLWMRNYGVSRSAMNHQFLGGLGREFSILEVGCNIGNQLLLLGEQGFSNLYGIDVQIYALQLAEKRSPGTRFLNASALQLPFRDGAFDVVFTSGVLIHIAPEDLSVTLGELYRCSRQYIFGAEYFAGTPTQVRYREHDNLLWKMDYVQEYMRNYGDLVCIAERRLPYLDNANVDTMFLLRKMEVRNGPRPS